MEDGWNLAQDRLCMLLGGSLADLLKILDCGSRLDAEKNVVCAAQDDHRGVTVAGDEAIESIQHLSGSVPVHAKIDDGVAPAFGD
jgi:hypothetical protein